MWVHDLRDADALCGGKALGLARLIEAGLAVPPGFVIDDRAFRHVVGTLDLGDPDTIGHVLADAMTRIDGAELPDDLEREVRTRAGDLSTTVAVRSSATIEDSDAGAGAGVFSSRRAVPVVDVWDAIRSVWTSALAPLAVAYARRRNATIAIGVVVQRYIDGTAIVVYTRPPGRPSSDEVLVQRGDRMTVVVRADVPRASEAELALRAEHVIGATGGADVELVQCRTPDAIQTWVVQARAIVHPVRPTLDAPPPIVLAPLADGRVWTWDVVHNPDPLSAAQIGLIERVDRAELSPSSLRVCAGYLYSSPRHAEPAPCPTVISAAELVQRAAALEAELESLLEGPPPTNVAEAIERYLACYAIWAGELSPLIASARSLTRHDAPVERPSAAEVVLASAARGEISLVEVDRRLGALAPCWDVATPTFGERPGLLREAVARLARPGISAPEGDPFPGVAQPISGRGASELSEIAADLAERDDVLFSRAQVLVRRALLARAHELGIDPNDIFWLPLDETSNPARIDPDDARRRAAAARSASERATRWRMPLVIGGSSAPPRIALHGVGTGSRVRGRVVRFASLAAVGFVGVGDVVVVRAVTPALAVFIGRCAAIVSESGGLLDHGAAMARELGITCVVGCHDAWHLLGSGMLVTVDGDAGIVTVE